MIELEYVGAPVNDLSISVAVNGECIACSIQQQWQAARGLTVYQLILADALPCDIERLDLSINTASILKKIHINRVIFSAERATLFTQESAS